MERGLDHEVEPQEGSEIVPMDRLHERLREGIGAAKSGRKAEARSLLLEVLQLEPREETALLWLVWVAETLPEAERYLTRLLDIDPQNPHALQALTTVSGQYIREGITAAKAGQKARARALLGAAVRLSPRNETALLWMASVAESRQQAEEYLQQLLWLNPDNQHAANALATLRKAVEPPPMWRCPICVTRQPEPKDRCPACRSVLKLTDAILDPTGVDAALVTQGLARLERQWEERADFSACYDLGLACLNARRLADGVAHLRAASRLRPDDEALRAEVETIASRAVAAALRVERRPQQYSGKTILVIDDSVTVRKVVAATLEAEGYRTMGASDGIEALAEIEKSAPDLIFLDINMPFMDGHQVCSAIKDNQSTRKIPVVMLSGKDGFFDKVRSRRAGASQHLSKPITPNDLLSAVKKHIGGPTR
jgi:twitching motility two-component system response regulator PilG